MKNGIGREGVIGADLEQGRSKPVKRTGGSQVSIDRREIRTSAHKIEQKEMKYTTASKQLISEAEKEKKKTKKTCIDKLGIIDGRKSKAGEYEDPPVGR